MENVTKQPNTPVVIWLGAVSFLIMIMVVLGGATRLSGAGLSMVDWSLIGNLPPLSQSAWLEVFEAYKKFPEYQLINYDMTVEQFKEIFWWEYLHRMLGRLIGMCFALPWFYFMIRRTIKFKSKLNLKLLLAFALGATQGFIGWYMVKSGLVKIPHISHLRLTTHLCTAFILVSYLVWVAMTELWPAKQKGFNKSIPTWLVNSSVILPALLLFQVAYGGLNAGLKAGYVFTDFPKMFGYLVPPHIFQTPTFLESLVFDITTVHFIHRTFAWVLFFGILGLWYFGKKALKAIHIEGAENLNQYRHHQTALNYLAIAVFGQFVLGVLTVLTHTQMHTALAHQVWGCALLLCSVNLIQQFRR